MLFKKQRTIWVWTSADGKWTSRREAEQKIDVFLSKVEEFEEIKIFGKKHHVKQWKDKTVTDYYYAMLRYPKALCEAVNEMGRSSGLSISNHTPPF